MAFPTTVPSVSAETISGVGTSTVGAANAIGATMNEYLTALNDLREDGYLDVGDLPTGTPLQVTWSGDNPLTYQPDRPALSTVDISAKIAALAAVAVPDAPMLSTPDITVADFDVSAPTITLPTVPDASGLGAAPTDTPTIIEATLPDAPTITLPTVPTFAELALPETPTVIMPAFDGELPSNTLTAPTAEFDYVDDGYTSSLRDPLVAKLLDNLTNGGYGIETSDETSLWNRARDRETQNGNAALEEMKRAASGTSFPMPQGAYYAALERARQDVMAKVSSLSRDIALKRADLYVENRKFTITEARGYETIAISLYNAIQERALNAAKASVELGIAVFDSAVKAFNTRLEAYKVEAQVFGERIKAELLRLEVYKTQMEGANLQLQSNKVKAEIYNSQLQGLNTVVGVYKARLEAANTLTEIQRLKLDMFKTRVSAYAETVRAKEAEFSMYKSAVDGQLAQTQVFKTQIDAYNATLSGKEAKARIATQANDTLVRQYSAEVTQYNSQLDSLVKQISGMLDSGRQENTVYDSDVRAFAALMGAFNESTRTSVLGQNQLLEWNKAVLASKVDQVRFRLGKLMATVDNNKDINKVGIEAMGRAFAASVSAISGLAVNTVSG